MAGGLGTRLRSVVDDRPKVLAEVNGRPFLEYLLAQMAEAGISQVVICIGYMGRCVVDQLGHTYRDVELLYSHEEELLGTAGALRLALPLLDKKIICLMNGDSYCALDLARFYRWHTQKYAAASIALVQMQDVSRYGSVWTDLDGRVVRFAEKDSGGGLGWVNAGVYFLSTDMIVEIPEGERVSLEKDVLPKWGKKNIFGYPMETQFIDIGTPESYSRAELFFG